MLAIAHPSVLPSAMRNDVGTPVAIISQLNTQPACAPVNASPTALQLPTHDSGSGWLATPFLCDSFIHNSTPVYPGALRNLLEHVPGTESPVPQALLEALVQSEISRFSPPRRVRTVYLTPSGISQSDCLTKVALITVPCAAPATGLIEVELAQMNSKRLPESETTKLPVPVDVRVAPVLSKAAPMQLPPR